MSYHRNGYSGNELPDDLTDDPVVESERRQIIFSKAIDLPSFYVGRNSLNRFLTGIIGKTKKTKASIRYRDMIRIDMNEYQRALLGTIEADGAELIREFGGLL